MRFIIFEEVKEIVFFFDISEVVVVFWNFIDGKVSLFYLIVKFVFYVEEFGVKFVEYIEVKDFIIENGEIKGLKISRGMIKIGIVVNVINVWVKFINVMVGIRMKILIEFYKY